MRNLGSKLIITDRLELRPQTIDEQKRLWEILMIPEVNKYFLTVPLNLREKLQDWSKQETFYIEDMKHANDVDVYRWSVFLKETNICIGRLTCHERSTEDSNIVDPCIRGVGWLIDPNFQGNGYGFEAADAMIKFMFEEVGIDEIITGAAIVNPASWKIMERLGFERQNETDFVQYTFLDEPVEDYRYNLTRQMYFDKKEKKMKY